MKQLFTSIYVVVLFCGLTVKVQVQGRTEERLHISGDNAASDNYSYLFDYSDIFNHTANKETGQRLVQRLFPTVLKFPFGESFAEKCAEIIRNNEIATNLYITEFQILRFEGPDIIHPFNYFW